ncbi:MAG: GNAT family N-acetyltransferase [Dehalococcoidia bacterium]
MQTRLALRRDLDDIVDTLVEAFFDDPVFSWMYADAEARPRHLRAWFSQVMPSVFEHGHCYVARATAAAVWVPPDIPQLTDPERSALVGLVASQTSPDHAMTVLRGFGAAGAHHPEEPPSMLLWYVGVRREAQGLGFGQQVLAPVLRLLDEGGLAAYLHSTNGRNVPFYQRLGWDVLAEVPMAPDGPVIRPMWRAGEEG